MWLQLLYPSIIHFLKKYHVTYLLGVRQHLGMRIYNVLLFEYIGQAHCDSHHDKYQMFKCFKTEQYSVLFSKLLIIETPQEFSPLDGLQRDQGQGKGHKKESECFF